MFLQEVRGANGVRVVFAAMSRSGILIEYGGLSPEPTPFPLATVLDKCLTLRGYHVHEITGDPRRLERAKAFIINGVGRGLLYAVVDRTFPFNSIVEAHRYLESNRQFGKIVVEID
jgi:NADPH:quinone reductase-like Zn-dependent oxidoreductase